MKSKEKLRVCANVIITLLFVFIIWIPAQAGILDYFDSNDIILIIGETKPLRVSNPRQVKIGNPDLLDVVGAARNELLLSGLAEGETALTIVDDFGQHSYTVKIFQEDLEKLKERVDILLEAAGFSQLTTRIGDKERKVFIIGELPTSKKESFESRIDSVKYGTIDLIEYRENVLSVQIDVEVLEISKIAMDEIGFEWAKSTTLNNARLTDFLSPSHALKVLKFPWDQDTWSVTLNFLKQNNKARTLSRPKIVCLSGKEATLEVGGERPFITASTTTTTDAGIVKEITVEQKPYGLTLSIKPTVRENGEIQVYLSTEITEIDESAAITLEDVSVPGTIETSTSTELTVMNGQTVFMAGLMKSKVTDVRDGIWGLSSIPFLGRLFRNKDYDKVDTEIVITLTPTIIRNQSAADTPTYTPAKTVGLSKTAITTEAVNSAMTFHSQKDDPIVNYSKLIQGIINSNIQYPQELNNEKIEGTVKLSLHLLATGELSGALIMRSSGSQLLDQAAEHAVKKLSPFPAFPSDVKLKELWIDIPIVYKANENT